MNKIAKSGRRGFHSPPCSLDRLDELCIITKDIDFSLKPFSKLLPRKISPQDNKHGNVIIPRKILTGCLKHPGNERRL